MDARRVGARSPDRAWARRGAVALGPASLRFRLERAGRGDGPHRGARHAVFGGRLLAARHRRRGSCARAAARAERACDALSRRNRIGRDDGRRAALACRGGPRRSCDSAGASLDESARGRMTKRREAEELWQDSGGARRVERPGRVGKEYEMKKAMLLGCAAVLSAIGWAKADPVDLSAYVDAN